VRSGTPTSFDQVDAMAFDSNNNNSNSYNKKVLPSSECNSEDSSLSDSDRTLVDDLSVMSTSNSPILSPDDYLVNLQRSYFKATFLVDDGSKCSNSGSIDSGNEDDAVGSSTDGQQKVVRCLADKDMAIGKLKEYLQPYVKVPMEYFKLFRMSNNQVETECTKLSDSLTNTFKDAERVTIELGRALRKDEFKCKLYFLNLSEINDDTEKIPFICEYILRNGAEVGQTKREILAHFVQIDKKYERLTFERTRLRKKNWKCPTKIYMDDQKFGDDIMLSSTSTASNEIIIQELPGDAFTDNDGQKIDDFSIVIFVRQFYPSKMEVGNYEEIVIGSECFF
jgi:ubiquitin carboxyl-terminal hydrolase 47